MSRLSLATLEALKSDVIKPAYDPERLAIGVVHFGPGAFHRAHQAAYLDAIAAFDPRWGICGVSLHSTGVRDALNPQDGLYTLAILDEEIKYQIIGSMREVLVGPEDIEAVLERLTRDSVGIVSSTVTEKGYCLTPDGALDFSHADIVHDVANPHTPKSFVGYVVEGLRRRHTKGQKPFVLIPCDNLPKNGHRLKAAVVALAAKHDQVLADWIETTLQCPCTMVDSITPATDDALRARVEAATGVADAWPIQREAFTQWVIEDHVHDGGPDWARAGVTLTDNVPAYERAKLRLLNGPHSTLAYVGLHKVYESVSEAMTDADLSAFVRDLMIEDVVPLLEAPKGLDLVAYSEAILKRFRNPAIRHLLSQIAWDGSQKLPIRLLGSLSEALARGADISRFGVPLAAWIRFVRNKAVTGEAIIDPLAAELIALGKTLNDDVSDVQAVLALRAVFPEVLANDAKVIAALEAAYTDLLAAEKVNA
ncbi:mannitol dehydrogenase family protein [Asticcacaulis sp. ZE23SCel15]|uniref:mannitol dehydrogenase family protein n=1 Tax=Asticcacaulis sp. ZE23SCel15 TaxID=3059027 RepID=UPI00265EDA28|nr:mannitol dehydrogenase family protein [Asticcacaulis sp. ZE23SCel15]WKL58072.1 mannitol dehydrogenase family protein [Asticcacaulis sp. ZE23SCel15]